MNKEEYFKITRLFKEVDNLVLQKQKLRRQINSVSRKLKGLRKKYSFLSIIINRGVTGELLEENIKRYFKELGFATVNKVGKHLKKEDIRIIKDDKIIIIEVTGSSKKIQKDDKTRQITKHLSVRKHNNENAFAVFVVNHDNKNSFKYRKEAFNKEQINYAVAGGYSLVSTIELVRGFIKVKTNKMSLMEFEQKLCSFGEVKF